MTRSIKIETAVGLFAVTGTILVVAIFFAMLGKEHAFESRFHLVAVFDNVSGLKTGAAVQLAGIDVGSVESVQFNEENKAEVVLQIRQRFRQRIYQDAAASIATMGLLGDKIIILTSGTRDAGRVEDGAVIATEKYVELADVMNQIRPAVENIQEIFGGISLFLASLNAPVKELEKVLSSAGQIAEQINAGQGTAGALLKDPELYAKLVSLIDDADQAIGQLQEVAEDIRATSKDLPELSEAARNTMATVQQSATQLFVLVTYGKEIAENVREAAKDFPELVRRTNRVATNLETITDSVKEASTELPDLIARGREGVEQGVELVEATRKSWPIRGYLAGEDEQKRAVETLRDGQESR